MKSSLITVIVPVYNVEKYLNKCVKSIVNQTYKNLEIILIDDGSQDGSANICDYWAEQDSRIRVVHKKNAGLSSARNTGISMAQGEYIGFVDSDDYIKDTMYEKLYIAIEQNKADLAICGFLWMNRYGKWVEKGGKCPISDELLTKEEAFQKLDGIKLKESWYYVTAFNKLYKKELFEHITFPDGKIHEDEFTIHHFFDFCTRIVTIHEILYYYIMRTGSITNSDFTIKCFDAFDAYWDRYHFFQEKGIEHLSDVALIGAYGTIINFMTLKSAHKYKTEFWPYVLKSVKELFQKRNLRVIKLLIIWFKFYLERM